MKAVFRIANRLRAGAPTPREFLPIPGLDHLGLVYQARVIETPEEFNEVHARLRDPRFPHRGCEFFPYLLTTEDQTKSEAAAEAAKEADAQYAARIKEAAAQAKAEAKAAKDAPDEGDPVEPPVENLTGEPAGASEFRMEGKSIYLGDERVAGLYGEEKTLRVMNADLREQIVAWLDAQPAE